VTNQIPRKSPLDGVRVVDFTTFLSGPYCTQILGDLGAEVIKVEPFEGDSSRTIPPYFVGDDSAYFLSTNRNKRSIALNLKTADGQSAARALIEKADIVVENYRPGVAAKLGFDPKVIRAAQPRLIWVSISGFGQEGPWSNRPAYDMTAQALSGVMSLTGEPGRPSVRLGIPAGDTIAGMYATIAALAALADLRQSGEGQTIDISMLDCQLSMLSYQAQYALVAGITPGPQAAGHDSIPTYRSFMGRDGRQFVITANTQRMWEQLCDVIGRPDLPAMTVFASQKSRLINKQDLWRILEASFATEDAQHWIDRLGASGVPVAPIRTVPEAIQDAREHDRGMIIPLQHEDGRAIDMVATPIRMDNVVSPKGFPPALNEDAAYILSDLLGMDAGQIEALTQSGALLAQKP